MRHVSLALLLLAVGCNNSQPKIMCANDAQCTLAGRPGVCINLGCAITDSSCPSGYRYDTMAGGSGDCVVLEPGTDLSMPMLADLAESVVYDMTMPADMTTVDFAFNPPDMAGTNDTPLMWSPKAGGDATTDYKGLWGAAATDVYTVGAGTTEIVHFYNSSVITGKPTFGRLNSVWETVNGAGFAVGVFGTIIQITNGGPTWLTQTSGTSHELNGVWGSGTQTLYAVGEQGVTLMTTNAGSMWTSGTGPSTSIIFLAVGGIGTDVYAVGTDTSNQSAYQPAIYHATVGANTWTAQTVPNLPTVLLRAVWAVTANEIYAVGDKGTILKSTGNGTWTQISATTTTKSLYGLGSDGAGGLVAVGDAGTLLHKFANNATDFFAENSGAPTKQLYGVFATGAHDVYVVGQSGTILHGQ